MKYKTIVIDPPWKVANGFNKKGFFHGQNKERVLPYKTMTDLEISEFPINNFAEDECDLFMWTIHSKLPFSLQTLEEWGFKFHVLMIWNKLSGVCIQGFYRNTELVIYAYRGKMGIDVGEGNYIPTLFSTRANGHSRKPDIFYKLLRERTKEPRIDIFARRRHFGFDAYGDQVEKDSEVPLFALSTQQETEKELNEVK